MLKNIHTMFKINKTTLFGKSLLFTLPLMIFCAANAYAASDITVTINDETVDFSKDPVIIEERTMIPLRGLFEELGYNVDWDGETKTATLYNGSTDIKISPNNYTYTVNGQEVSCDVPAQIVSDSLYLPLRTIGESTDLSVEWDSDTKTVKLYTSNSRSLTLTSVNSYLESYSKIVAPLEEKSHIFDNLMLGGNTPMPNILPQIIEYKTMLENARKEIDDLSVPASLDELNQLHLESIDKYIEFCDIIIQYYNNELPESELSKEINYMNKELSALDTRIINALSKL